MMERLLTAMIEYDRGDAPRIQHFIKVYEFARIIGKLEKLEELQKQKGKILTGMKYSGTLNGFILPELLRRFHLIQLQSVWMQ